MSHDSKDNMEMAITSAREQFDDHDEKRKVESRRSPNPARKKCGVQMASKFMPITLLFSVRLPVNH
jgi:hypothetical protein